ncbi:importin subunit alpha-4 [Anaeramoeba flamelloides]|uniref:Importin subunit alpha n=1 Tax=Anaeramoeba flamelloides TaxID=1746091 RepID=A0AAV7ZF89_9EUKA|nr:importin subunit alpha-4 [Anaeramoeba flamelloides]KAJ6255167.1 importin subunit alpha-4 [Anaeramoeba flamelloides]
MSTFHKKLLTRRKQYKSTRTKEKTIERRYKQQIQISKIKRQKLLNKKRNLLPTTELNQYLPKEITNYINDLPQLAKQLQSENKNEKIEASVLIRNLLSIPEDPPIDQVLQCKILPILVDFLQDPKEPDLQFNAAWSISNIASGLPEHTKLVVEYNTIPIFIDLIGSQNDDIRHQSIWALGNIVGEDISNRNRLLEFNAISILCDVVNQTKNFEIVKISIWVLRHLCKGNPAPSFVMVKPLMAVFKKTLMTSDREIIVEATTALGHLAEGSKQNIQLIIDHKIVPVLVDFLKSEDNIIKFPSLRCLGNLITGTEEQIVAVLENGLIPYLVDFIQSKKIAIRKEACWILSNICACSAAAAQEVIKEGALPHLIDILENDINQIIKEVCYVISNMIHSAKVAQCRYIASQGIIPIITRLLSNEDQEIVSTCMESLDIFFKVESADSEYQNKELTEYITQFEEEEGIEKIVKLMDSRIIQIRKQATFFYLIHLQDNSDDEDDDDEDEIDDLLY